MRTRKQTLIITACALALAGCTSADPSTQDPGTPPPTTAPATPSASSSTAAPAPDVPGDVPAEALLPATAWPASGGAREESEGVVDWRLPQACATGGPAGALAMRTVAQGDGAAEAPVGVQQVAVLADADAAMAEVDRLTAALTACTGYASDSSTTYVVEPLAVGAQGVGLATDYYGSSASGDLDGAIGSYLGVTRRGAAVTVVALEGGESTVGAARETVTGATQAAWELLCAYDAEGC
jgi:glucose/arabinose dehydrogenase